MGAEPLVRHQFGSQAFMLVTGKLKAGSEKAVSLFNFRLNRNILHCCYFKPYSGPFGAFKSSL